MHFLDMGSDLRRDNKAVIGEPSGGYLAAVPARQAGRRKPARACRNQCRGDVGRGAGGGESDQHVAGPAERLDLAGEDLFIAKIVAGRRQRRAVGGQRNRRKPLSRGLETDRTLGRDMLRIGSAAAVAAEEKLAPGFQHRYSRFGERRRRREQSLRSLEDGKVFLIAAGEFSRHRGAVGFQIDSAFRESGRKPVQTAMDASLIDRLAQAKVLVIGDVLLDRFVEGTVRRVSPEAPVPVLNHTRERSLLGGAGNVAANLLAYGASVTLVGVAGADSGAEELRRFCDGFERLTCRLIEDESRPTTVKTRYLSGWHQLLRVDAEAVDDLPASVARDLLAAAREALPDADVVILSDYAKGVLGAKTIASLIGAAREAGTPVIADPKKPQAAVFAGATLVTPNTLELERFTGRPVDSDAAAEEACRSVLETCGLDAILVTRGHAGMTLVAHNADALHVRAENRRVFDVTGAGDTVVATLAAAMAIGVPLADAVRLANAAAGVAVAKPGTATVHPRELKQALGVEASANVLARQEGLDQVGHWKSQGLLVGFTNGCFDLLHRGHLHSLEQASRRVDRLVVGINSDASAKRLKGPGRPVQDAETRAAVLAALRFVDLVVPFEEDTPADLIGAVLPDVLFKGADYAENEVVGGDVVKANGGRVELIPLLPGHSTTGTVGRMKSAG